MVSTIGMCFDDFLFFLQCRWQVVALREELTKMQAIAERAQGTWDKFRKERDFHRMHHMRVVQASGSGG